MLKCAADNAGVFAQHREQNARRAIRHAAALLPVPQRRDGHADLTGERGLAQARFRTDGCRIDGARNVNASAFQLSGADEAAVFLETLNQAVKIGFLYVTLLNCLVNASEALTNCFFWPGDKSLASFFAKTHNKMAG